MGAAGRALYPTLGRTLAAEGRAAMAINYQPATSVEACSTSARRQTWRSASRLRDPRPLLRRRRRSRRRDIPEPDRRRHHYATQSVDVKRDGWARCRCSCSMANGFDPRSGELDDGAGAGWPLSRTFPDTDHLMSEAAEEIEHLTIEWVRDRFDEHAR